MTKPMFTTHVSPARKGRGKPRPSCEDRLPLVDFLKSLDLDGLDLSRERDLGRD